MLLPFLTTVTLAVTVSATKLFVSSYNASLVTLELKMTEGIHSLLPSQVSQGCAPNATWLHLDPKHDILYCIDENIPGLNGSLHSFKLEKESGILTHVANLTIARAPVHATIYTSPKGEQLLAVAHYAWALTTYRLSPDGKFAPLQQFNFTMSKPGANAARQEAPHPHQARVDATNQYLIVPDLGADILRIFHIDPDNLNLSPRKSFELPPGSGPRHGDLFRRIVPQNGTCPTSVERHFYYLVTELSNTLYGYAIVYLPKQGGLSFDLVGSSSTYGDNKDPVFATNFASEITARYPLSLLVSNRNAPFFSITDPASKSSTKIPSDTLATFTIDPNGQGGFKFDGLSPAGGLYPRDFAINREGNLVAVGLQNSGKVAIFERNKETGKVNDTILVECDGLGGVTSVRWLE